MKNEGKLENVERLGIEWEGKGGGREGGKRGGKQESEPKCERMRWGGGLGDYRLSGAFYL